MKYILSFLLTVTTIFAIEKNIAIGAYAQDGQYKSQGVQVYPNILATYGDYYIEGLEFGRVLYNDKFKLTGFYKYETVTGMEAKELDTPYQNLDDRNSPSLLGLRMKKQHKYVTYGFEGFGDFTSDSFGIGAGFGAKFRPYKPLFLIPYAKLYYYGKGYGDYFYGISKEEAAKTSFDYYQAGDGLRAEISLDTLFFISEEMGFAFRATYEVIDKDWNSEIIEDRYSLKGTLLFVYRF